MCEELVKKLRRCGKGLCTEDCPDWTKENLYHTCQDELVLEAADAIEELQHSLEIMGDANAKLRDAAWDVTCDPEYRESHFQKDEWGE